MRKGSSGILGLRRRLVQCFGKQLPHLAVVEFQRWKSWICGCYWSRLPLHWQPNLHGFLGLEEIKTSIPPHTPDDGIGRDAFLSLTLVIHHNFLPLTS